MKTVITYDSLQPTLVLLLYDHSHVTYTTWTAGYACQSALTYISDVQKYRGVDSPSFGSLCAW